MKDASSHLESFALRADKRWSAAAGRLLLDPPLRFLDLAHSLLSKVWSHVLATSFICAKAVALERITESGGTLATTRQFPSIIWAKR